MTGVEISSDDYSQRRLLMISHLSQTISRNSGGCLNSRYGLEEKIGVRSSAITADGEVKDGLHAADELSQLNDGF